MYTIISGTNRPGSNTLKIAQHYQQALLQKGVEAQLVNLETVPVSVTKTPEMEAFELEVLQPSRYFIFVCPEYNGSIPGILKLMMDQCKPNPTWNHKKAVITGVATGRAGNLRGIDHLTAILHHLKILVHPNGLPISSVDKLLDTSGNLKDEPTIHTINKQLDEFLTWTQS